jgi:hypothetical protein
VLAVSPGTATIRLTKSVPVSSTAWPTARVRVRVRVRVWVRVRVRARVRARG